RAALRARTGTPAPARGWFGRLVGFVLCLVVLGVIVIVGARVLGVDPALFGHLADRLRELFQQ
ncbi:MAG: hypothetical protein QM582_04780, partial [Micropruina sp.]|uniref:hypothetical protein n=1 Tax=Micropruina sp. TaxID=2737536 RepID=UPI0039E430D1